MLIYKHRFVVKVRNFTQQNINLNIHRNELTPSRNTVIKGFPDASRRTLLKDDFEDLSKLTLKTIFPRESAKPKSPLRPGCFLETKRSTGIGTTAGYTGAQEAIEKKKSHHFMVFNSFGNKRIMGFGEEKEKRVKRGMELDWCW